MDIKKPKETKSSAKKAHISTTTQQSDYDTHNYIKLLHQLQQVKQLIEEHYRA